MSTSTKPELPQHEVEDYEDYMEKNNENSQEVHPSSYRYLSQAPPVGNVGPLQPVSQFQPQTHQPVHYVIENQAQPRIAPGNPAPQIIVSNPNHLVPVRRDGEATIAPLYYLLLGIFVSLFFSTIMGSIVFGAGFLVYRNHKSSMTRSYAQICLVFMCGALMLLILPLFMIVFLVVVLPVVMIIPILPLLAIGFVPFSIIMLVVCIICCAAICNTSSDDAGTDEGVYE